MTSAQPQLNFGSVTAPRYEDDPVSWAVWFLEENGQVYQEFRRLCDERLGRDPEARIGSKQVVEVIRWFTPVRAEGDVAKINNNATSLLARLYVLERPQHKDAFTTRKSIWDSLSHDEEERLMLAFEKVRMKKWR